MVIRGQLSQLYPLLTSCPPAPSWPLWEWVWRESLDVVQALFSGSRNSGVLPTMF